MNIYHIESSVRVYVPPPSHHDPSFRELVVMGWKEREGNTNLVPDMLDLKCEEEIKAEMSGD